LRGHELSVDVLEPEPIFLRDLVVRQVQMTDGTVRNYLIFYVGIGYITAVDEIVVSGSITVQLLVKSVRKRGLMCGQQTAPPQDGGNLRQGKHFVRAVYDE